MTSTPLRRVVTGLDADGKSCILIDGPADQVIWATAETPVDNSGTADQGGGFSFAFPRGGSKFVMLEMPPGDGLFGPGMHATDTIDYIAVLKGEVVLVTETEEVRCGPGDMIVDRGVMHGWRNHGPDTVFMAIAMIDAAPVGAGATI